MTTKTVFFLFGTFLMLYVSSEIPDRLLAESVIQKVNIASVIVTLLIVIPAGRLSDRLSARILIPLSFTVTSLALFIFYLLPSLGE